MSEIQRWNGREPFYEDGPGGKFVTFEDHQIATFAAAAQLEAKIAEMEATNEKLLLTIKHLEEMVPRWVLILSAEENELTSLGWSISARHGAKDSAGNPLNLMVPPIPVPKA